MFTVWNRIRKFFFRLVWKKKKKEKTDNPPNRSGQTVTDRRQRPVNISKSDQSRSARDTRKRLEPVRDTVHHHERGTLWQQQA